MVDWLCDQPEPFRVNDKRENLLSVSSLPQHLIQHQKFYIVGAPEDIIPLDITVDEALKYIISLGTVNPQTEDYEKELSDD